MVDLFFIFDLTFIMMIDEAIRYKVAALLPDRSASTIMSTLLLHWFRYFGPPKRLKSDQEGGITADEVSLVCDRFSIHRQLSGSDDSGKHTSTGLAERHIRGSRCR